MARSDTAADAPPAPAARVEPYRRRVHGVEIDDPYHWLSRREDPEVRAYLEAENAYTEAMTAHLTGDRTALYDELLGRIREDDVSPDAPWGPWLYYSRTEVGRPYAIHCRRAGPASSPGPEEVLLDENELAEGADFFELGALEVSPDHCRMVWAVDREGDETYELAVLDLATGETRILPVQRAAASLAWAADGETLFAVQLDDAHRPFRVVRYLLGAESCEPVFEEPDELFFVDVERALDDSAVLIQSASSRTTETWFVPAEAPQTEPRRLYERRQDVEAYVEATSEALWIVTNFEAPEFRLMRAPLAGGAPESWEEVLPERPGVKLDGVEVFRERLVLAEREDGLAHLRFVPLVDGEPDLAAGHRVELPDTFYALGSGDNLEPAAARYRFTVSSPARPTTWLDYDPETRRLETVKVQEVVGGHDPDRYATARVFAEAVDGARIPVSLVHRGDAVPGNGAPCLLYGYGAYGICVDPGFSPHMLSLLDRGFVYAVAHVRGGGELGKAWHEAGRMEAKENSFTDFVAAAEALVTAGWATPERLAIRGGSAGGLLIGAVLNARPDLAAVALAHVPFVDVLNTMLDPELPLTVTEYEEWGDPAERGAFERIRAYAPYENVRAVDYPHILVTAGWSDPRVQYWEAAKWVARLRARKTGDGLLLLKTHLDAGHFGGSGRYREIEEKAFELAFLLDRLAIPI